MKILIVTQYFWPENFRINDLSAGLREMGFDVTVLTGQPNYPGGNFFPGYSLFGPSREDYHGVKVLRVPLMPRGRSGRLRLILNYVSFVVSACLVGPFRCRGRYDYIFALNASPITAVIPALLLKKLKRSPVLMWVLDLWPESIVATGAIKSPRIVRWTRRMVSWIYSNCDQILVQSRAFMPSVEANGAQPNRIRYFPSWAEDLYRALPRRAKPAGIEIELPAGFRVMFAGNIGAAQDFETILDAAERLRFAHIQWVVVGNGRMLPWVKEEVERRNLSEIFHLLGQYPVEQMPELFACADVMLASLKAHPIFASTIPGKIQSYLACGRPIIAALDGEGAKVVEESGAGVSCPSGDSVALAEAVLRVSRMSLEDREVMGRNGLDYYRENFDRNVLFSQLASWMNAPKSCTGADRHAQPSIELNKR